MNYKEWFGDLNIEYDIESVHSLYHSVKGKEAVGDFDTKQVGIKITTDAPCCDPYEFANQKEADDFCIWLDELYSPSVDIRRYEAYQNSKND